MGERGELAIHYLLGFAPNLTKQAPANVLRPGLSNATTDYMNETAHRHLDGYQATWGGRERGGRQLAKSAAENRGDSVPRDYTSAKRVPVTEVSQTRPKGLCGRDMRRPAFACEQDPPDSVV